jgi:hypothetical protein
VCGTHGAHTHNNDDSNYSARTFRPTHTEELSNVAQESRMSVFSIDNATLMPGSLAVVCWLPVLAGRVLGDFGVLQCWRFRAWLV